jgi:DNA-binding IscR family transcriptional regulator
LAPIACANRTAYRPCPDCPNETACAVRSIMVDVRDSMALILDRTSDRRDARTRPGTHAAAALIPIFTIG